MWLTAADEEPPDGTDVTLENLGFVRWNYLSSADNLVSDDPDVVADELAAFGAAGGSALLDLTVVGRGRRVAELPAIARRAGVHVAVGCASTSTPRIPRGWSAPASTPAPRHCAWSSRRASTAPGSSRRSSRDRHERARDRTRGEDRAGRRARRRRDRRRRRGAVLSYDTFGAEFYFPGRRRQPTDLERCELVRAIVDAGFAAQLVLGCDYGAKATLRRYGGMGYEHLPRRIVPLLRERCGIADEALEQILVRTPRRLLERP